MDERGEKIPRIFLGRLRERGRFNSLSFSCQRLAVTRFEKGENSNEGIFSNVVMAVLKYNFLNLFLLESFPLFELSKLHKKSNHMWCFDACCLVRHVIVVKR